jgi:DNA-binding transcriptional LysR family regulator
MHSPKTSPDGGLDWNLLRSFAAVVEEGSLSKAAHRLGLTQPTLGRHIRQLESWFGEPLFDRLADGLRPTERGRELAAQAAAMASLASTVAQLRRGPGDEICGVVRISAGTFMAGEVLPPILARISAAHPRLRLEILATDEFSNLGRREADIAIRFARSVQNDLIQRHVAGQRFGFFASRTLVAGHGPGRGLDDLARYPLVGPLRDEVIVPVFAALGVPVDLGRFVLRSDSAAVRDTAIRAGHGAGLMPVAFAERDPALVRLLPDFVWDLPVYLVAHADLRRQKRLRVAFDMLAAALGPASPTPP